MCLILITVNIKKTKKEALYNCANISAWKNFFIFPDLILTEQQESKVLHYELKKRRNQGETNVIIKNGKIIQRQKRAALSNYD